MNKKIYYQFDGTDQVWISEEYNLELNVNQTRSEMGLPYWTDYKIITNDRTNLINDNNSEIDNPNHSSGSHQEPTSVRKPTRTRKAKS